MGILHNQCNGENCPGATAGESQELVMAVVGGVKAPYCRKCLGVMNARAIKAAQIRAANTPPTVNFIHPNALCPCGSKLKAKRCCGVGGEKAKLPMRRLKTVAAIGAPA